MKFIKPSVTLIKEIGSEVPMYAWMKSRPMLNPEWEHMQSLEDLPKHPSDELVVGNKPRKWKDYVPEVLKLGLQYNNLTYYVFELDCSVLFRDFLFNMNECGMWAASNRKFPAQFCEFTYEHYPMSGEYSMIENQLKEKLDEYLSDINQQVKDEVTELNRDKLPMAMGTHIFFSATLTQITSMVNVMRKYMRLFYEVYGRQFEKLVTITSESYISDEHKKYLQDVTAEIGVQHLPMDFAILTANMSYSIHAQFLRHKASFTVGYWASLAKNLTYDYLPLYGDEIVVSSMMPESRLKSMISTRTCAFSQSIGSGINSWAHIMDIACKDFTFEDFIKNLPCHGCRRDCKYYHDICARDPNATEKESQCPILLRDATQFKKDRGNKLGDYYYKLVNEKKLCTLNCKECTFRKINK